LVVPFPQLRDCAPTVRMHALVPFREVLMTTTAIQFCCDQCKLNGFARPEWAGKKVKCPRCGHISRVPASDATPAPEPSPVDATAPTQLRIALPDPASIPAGDTLHDLHVKSAHTQWEYQVVRPDLGDDSDLAARLTDAMNVRGAAGWECVG